MKYYKLIAQTREDAWKEQNGSPMKIGRIVSEYEVINRCTMGYWIKGQEKYWQEVHPSEYFVQEGKLPEYFAIKRIEANPLWKKYIDWLSKTYNTYWTGDSDSYYGYDGVTSYNGTERHDKIQNFNNNPIELTLEQWDKIINKSMEKEIIGYKLKEDCKQYEEAAIQITGFIKGGTKPFEEWMKDSADKEFVRSLRKARVLELWFEPIYKEITPNITIKGYKAEFTDNFVNFGCQAYSEDFVVTLSECLESNNIAMEYRKEIKQIAEYFINKE